MQILFLTGREESYQRNQVLLRAFRRIGTVEVTSENSAGSLTCRIARVFMRTMPHLLSKRFNLIFVGFYGYPLVLLLKAFARVPVLFDAHVSTYDTLCFDRNLFRSESLRGRSVFWLDQTACRMASRVLLDTRLHAEYFVQTFGLAPKKVSEIPVGCNEDIFFPRELSSHHNGNDILYYCSYQPLHGAESVVRAASLLKSEPELRFRLIGTGPEYVQVRRLADRLRVTNIDFVPSIPLENLAAEIASASICLGGHFGTSSKAGRVVPGKIYQILAMGRSLIAGDTPANRDLLSDGETVFCPPNSPEALAQAILKLHRNPTLRNHLAAAGHALYVKRCSEAVITKQLNRIILEMTR